MNFPSEWLEFFGLLKSHDVEFVIVGAYALAANGRPRASQDIDIFVKPSVANARRLSRALETFGYVELAKAAVTEFAVSAKMASLGRPPLQIDIMNAIDGVSFAEASAGAIVDSSGGIELGFLGLRELVANKTASGRTKDKLDIELLREAGLLED
jgi:hypothetical protein